MCVDARAFKDAMARFASGVTVVTINDGDGDGVIGITVSAFVSVSLDPPLVLVSIDKRAPAHAAIPRAGRFAVSILAAGQEGVSNHFASRRSEAKVELTRPDTTTPVVLGALAWIDCALYSATEAGDHTLYLGLVEGIGSHDGDPLVYWKGGYRRVE